MSENNSDDAFGDTDLSRIGEGEDRNDQDVAAPSPEPASVGDGLPGYPVQGHPRWRAGVVSGRGLLGMVRLSDQAPFAGEGDPRLMLASRTVSPAPNPNGGQAMPRAYMPDGHGGVQLKPDFAATHPKGPLDFGGMSKEIDWPGVGLDLGSIAAGAVPLAGAGAADVLKAMPGMGLDAWRELHHETQAKKRRSDS